MQMHMIPGMEAMSHAPSPEALSSAISFQKVLAQLTADSADDEGTVHLSYLALLFAALLMIINGLLSVYLSLGLHKTLAVAAVRSVNTHQQHCLGIRLKSPVHCLNPSIVLCSCVSIKSNLTVYQCNESQLGQPRA